MSIITIPPEVVEAAAKAMALHDAKGDPQRGDFRWREYGHAYVSAAQVALAAALAAWPGAWQQHITSPTLNRPFSLILPLPQERGDEP